MRRPVCPVRRRNADTGSGRRQHPGRHFSAGQRLRELFRDRFSGRFGIFEIFVIDDEARKLIYEKVPSSILRTRAREMGMRTLREDGIRKVQAGLTTPDEVIRATVGDVD